MKTINRKMLMSAVAAVAVSAASAAALKWTVNANEGFSYDKISFKAYGADGKEISYTSVTCGEGVFKSGEDFFKWDSTGAKVKPYSGDNANVWQNVGSVIFTFGNGNTTVATTGGSMWGKLSWEDFYKSFKEGNDFTTGIFGSNGQVGTMTFAVPEPTSGLMLLLGAGMLALRRKRCVA